MGVSVVGTVGVGASVAPSVGENGVVRDEVDPAGAGRVLPVATVSLEAVTAYAGEQGINYPLLIGEESVSRYMRALGNTIGALPFSALIAGGLYVGILKFMGMGVGF